MFLVILASMNLPIITPELFNLGWKWALNPDKKKQIRLLQTRFHKDK
jgi:hypothetical protein